MDSWLLVMASPTLAYDSEFCFRVTWIAVLCEEKPMTRGEWKKYRESRPALSRWKHPPSRASCKSQRRKLTEFFTLCHLLHDFSPPGVDEPAFPDSYKVGP